MIRRVSQISNVQLRQRDMKKKIWIEYAIHRVNGKISNMVIRPIRFGGSLEPIKVNTQKTRILLVSIKKRKSTKTGDARMKKAPNNTDLLLHPSENEDPKELPDLLAFKFCTEYMAIGK